MVFRCLNILAVLGENRGDIDVQLPLDDDSRGLLIINVQVELSEIGNHGDFTLEEVIHDIAFIQTADSSQEIGVLLGVVRDIGNDAHVGIVLPVVGDSLRQLEVDIGDIRDTVREDLPEFEVRDENRPSILTLDGMLNDTLAIHDVIRMACESFKPGLGTFEENVLRSHFHTLHGTNRGFDLIGNREIEALLETGLNRHQDIPARHTRRPLRGVDEHGRHRFVIVLHDSGEACVVDLFTIERRVFQRSNIGEGSKTSLANTRELGFLDEVTDVFRNLLARTYCLESSDNLLGVERENALTSFLFEVCIQLSHETVLLMIGLYKPVR